MESLKRLKKSEKGSIVLFVLTAMIFMVVVISISYFAMSSKMIEQNKKITQISKQYRASKEDMEQEYRDTLNNASLTLEQAKTTEMFDKTTNTVLVDVYGNRIVVPAGFKIAEDTNDVTKGIVVEDKVGNQFVWVPIGTVYTNVEKTESKTITLSRYTFETDGIPINQNSDIIDDIYEELKTSSYENAVAKNLQEFIDSSNNNCGYYIGRYEAGVIGYDANSIETSNRNSETNWTGYTGDDIQLVCKTGQQVWNYVTQNKAAELSRNMYTSSNFTSDLINSYAWDTAIVFIQEFSGDSDYSNQGAIQSLIAKTGEATDGINNDVRCNIYDMAGNTLEWTTETSNLLNAHCVYRGGYYNPTGIYRTCRRDYKGATNVSSVHSFRPLLYLK